MTANKSATIFQRLNPAVPRRYLFLLAGGLWTIAGALLCWRGAIWLDVFPFLTEFALESISIVLAAAGYFYLVSRLVKQNIDRICELPERACMFACTAWRGYFMIALMMAIGITLRNSSIPSHYLSIPYTAMGGALLAGSARFYREFLAIGIRDR